MKEPIVVEAIYNKSINKVWKAITGLDQMKLWFFDAIPAFKPEVGFKTKFTASTAERDFIHLWQITEVVEEHKIVYDWRYENYKGAAIAIFEILKIDQGTQLRLTCYGLDTFPQDIPEFTRESCLAGWTYFIKDSLKRYLES